MEDEIQEILDDTHKERAMDVMEVEWNEERLKQAEAILKDLALFGSHANINLISKKAKDYFNPKHKIVDSWS